MLKRISNVFTKQSANVVPYESRNETIPNEKSRSGEIEMNVIRLHTLFKLYGGQRHPRLEQFNMLKKRGDLTEYKYVPPDSTIVYISHEWAGTTQPDPEGNQMYHLLLLLERLKRGDISRTDMDPFHSLLYKQNHATTVEKWKQILSSEKTFIWYDGSDGCERNFITDGS